MICIGRYYWLLHASVPKTESHSTAVQMAVSKRSLLPNDQSIREHATPGVSAERAVSDWRNARGLKQAALTPPGEAVAACADCLDRP